jgi:hypothetical protein
MQRRIEVWESGGYWIYELWIHGRCVLIGRAATRERAHRQAHFA